MESERAPISNEVERTSDVASFQNEPSLALVISICICTYRRPSQLNRLLSAIENLTFEPSIKPDIHVVVVDNDAHRSAENVCRAHSDRFKKQLEYDVVSERNIALTRNRTLEIAVKKSDFVAFIDDDEYPEVLWLENLIKTQRDNRADIVIGPVLPLFVEGTPSWVIEGEFFKLPRFPTGTRLDDGMTGNALVSCSLLRRHGLRFDTKLGLTGGEDQFFFRQANALGAHIVYANEAVVHEDVPLARANFSYIVRRQFRVGNTLSLSDLALNSSMFSIFRRLAKASARICYGALCGLLALAKGSRSGLVRSFGDVSRGFGMLAGLIGYRFLEYKRTT